MHVLPWLSAASLSERRSKRCRLVTPVAYRIGPRPDSPTPRTPSKPKGSERGIERTSRRINMPVLSVISRRHTKVCSCPTHSPQELSNKNLNCSALHYLGGVGRRRLCSRLTLILIRASKFEPTNVLLTCVRVCVCVGNFVIVGRVFVECMYVYPYICRICLYVITYDTIYFGHTNYI